MFSHGNFYTENAAVVTPMYHRFRPCCSLSFASETNFLWAQELVKVDVFRAKGWLHENLQIDLTFFRAIHSHMWLHIPPRSYVLKELFVSLINSAFFYFLHDVNKRGNGSWSKASKICQFLWYKICTRFLRYRFCTLFLWCKFCTPLLWSRFCTWFTQKG